MGLKFIDLAGKSFGEWTVQERAPVEKVSLWKCACSCGDITKVGITNRSASLRAKQVSRSFGAEFKVEKEVNFEDGQKCSAAETSLLRLLRASYSNPDSKFEGFTESFLHVDKPWLYEQIEMLGVYKCVNLPE